MAADNTSKKRLLLLNPPPNADVGAHLNLENLGLGYIAASIKRNLAKTHEAYIWDCSIVDPGMQHIETLLQDIRPDYIGFSLTSMNALPGMALADAIKRHRPESKIILGGILATSLTAEELADYHPDAIVRGEGEALIVDVLRQFDATGDMPLLEVAQKTALDVDALGWPSREMLPWQLQRHPQASISGSRGCPFHCSFCSIPRAGKINTWRPRDIEDVVEEILFLNKRYGVYHFYFVDDNFVITSAASYNRAARFAELILKKAPPIRFGFMCRSAAIEKNLFHLLKKAGLAGVFLGIESFSQPVLDRYKKRETVGEHLQAIETLNNLGITVNPGFIFFDQWTTKAEVDETIAVMQEIDFPALQSMNSKLTCYRGTLIEKNITPSDQKSRKPGIIPYEFKEKTTCALFETCCNLFYKQLPSIKAYCDYQILYYSLGYIFPYYLNTGHEDFFTKLYTKCTSFWKSGDFFILQAIRDNPSGTQNGSFLEAVKQHCTPYWEKGNEIAKSTLEYSTLYFIKQLATDSSQNAHIASLFFTLPRNKAHIEKLFNFYTSCPKQNHTILARLLAYCNTNNNDLQIITHDDNPDTILELLNSAVLTNNATMLQAIDKHLSSKISNGPCVTKAVNKAKHLFSLDYPEYIMEYGRSLDHVSA
ncbi:B12-binding domain-containing radical SAM protein [Desulfovibrio sp. JY]|nr:B12-binding domain-containing radical SAM protein [Desulfovibrio sp. JY]